MMRMRPTEYPHIFWNEDKNLPCVSGTRLRVQDVVGVYVSGGFNPEEVLEAYSVLSRAELHSALAYYYDHQAEMDALMAEHEASIEAHRAYTASLNKPSPLIAYLKEQGLPS